MAEFELIDLIARRCRHVRDDVRLGIGDDAAIVRVPPGFELAIATDTLVVGVHFPHDARAADIGWKALAVNLSDLAAMGAEPAWASLALTLPHASRGLVADLADGLGELAELHRVALIGGDTTAGPLSLTVSVQGLVPEGMALRRGGARSGDRMFVTGTLGDAAAGLHVHSHAQACAEPARADLLARLHRPTPRVAVGLALRGLATACIDVSDGLLADLAHVARASGVGMRIDADALPASAALAENFDLPTRRRWQLAGGDDYELAFTVPAGQVELLHARLAELDCRLTCIGEVVEGREVRVHDASGQTITLDQQGWEHFR